MKCSVKKFGGRAKVNVMFWIWRGVERENTSEERHSFVVRNEARCKKRQFVVDDGGGHVQCCCCRRCFFRFTRHFLCEVWWPEGVR